MVSSKGLLVKRRRSCSWQDLRFILSSMEFMSLSLALSDSLASFAFLGPSSSPSNASLDLA